MSRNFNAMGTRIKMRRKELKMSQAELAEKINVSNNHIFHRNWKTTSKSAHFCRYL